MDKNGGSEEDKKLLAELNLLAKTTTTKVKEGKEEEVTSINGKRAKFQPSSIQQASLLAAFADNSLPSSEAKKILAEKIGMAVKSVGFWFVNYRAKMTKKGKAADLPAAKEGKEKENTVALPEAKEDEEVENIEVDEKASAVKEDKDGEKENIGVSRADEKVSETKKRQRKRESGSFKG